MMKRLLFALAVMLIGGTAQAQLFSGGAFFSTLPSTQLGPMTHTLTITNTAGGFFVAGVATINVPPTGAAGTLLSYIVDRPLNPAYGTNTLTTTTVLDGFSQPPVGAVGNTSGYVNSEFTNFPGASQSIIPITLPGGTATWVLLSNTSAPFVYTSGGTNYLRQRFDLDGVYQGGPGGAWLVDIPAWTTANAIPEPATAALAGLGLGVLVLSRWRQR